MGTVVWCGPPHPYPLVPLSSPSRPLLVSDQPWLNQYYMLYADVGVEEGGGAGVQG